jgi:hypothetical protein
MRNMAWEIGFCGFETVYSLAPGGKSLLCYSLLPTGTKAYGDCCRGEGSLWNNFIT